MVRTKIDLEKCEDDRSIAVNVNKCPVCMTCETQCPNDAIEIIE